MKKTQCMRPGSEVQYIFGSGKIFLLIRNFLLIGLNFYRKVAALNARKEPVTFTNWEIKTT